MAPSHIFLVVLLCLNSLRFTFTNGDDTGLGNWINHGGNLANTRNAYGETKISPATVGNLSLKWEFVAGKDISATPAIYNGILYFPSWNGNIYALNAMNGSLIWEKNLDQLTGLTSPGTIVNYTLSRSTPTVADDLLIVGIYGPAYVIGLERSTGDLVWSTQLANHPAALVTMSGTYYRSGFYVGTSSLEEITSNGQCCTFRGSFTKLDAKNGSILWQTYMLPDNNGATGGYSGAAIWGSSPSIDIHRNAVYIATGNLYSAPLSVTQCQEQENNQTTPTQPDKCVEPDDHSESILALDLDSGKLRWHTQLGGYDVWYFACINPSTPGCPPGPSADADFGEAPMMLTTNVHGHKRDMVVAVQKSGYVWALDRDCGSIIWSTLAGPGGLTGGGIWGGATDGKPVYTNIANSMKKAFTLKPTNATTTSGGWVSLGAVSGDILWSRANPSNAMATGPVTLANGVLFAGSINGTGPVYGMNADTGEILWTYNTGATVYGGMSVSHGCVYVGNGYGVRLGKFDPSYTAGTSLFAFCL